MAVAGISEKTPILNYMRSLGGVGWLCKLPSQLPSKVIPWGLTAIFLLSNSPVVLRKKPNVKGLSKNHGTAKKMETFVFGSQ